MGETTVFLISGWFLFSLRPPASQEKSGDLGVLDLQHWSDPDHGDEFYAFVQELCF
jgi:hypothetical protein